MTTNGKQVTMKSTKTEMWAAYKAALKALEKEKAPEEIKKEAYAKEVVVRADKVDTIEGALDATMSRFRAFIDAQKDTVSKLVAQYRDVKEAIALRDKELKDIYGIEREANSLVALMQARVTTEAEWEEARRKFTESMDEWNANEDKRRNREEAEWKYEFGRQRKSVQDQFTDDLNTKKREFDTQCQAKVRVIDEQRKALDEREEKLGDTEKRIKELETQLESERKSIQEKVQAAKAEGNAAAARSHGFETRALKADHQAALSVANARIESLKERITSLEKEVDAHQKASEYAQAKLSQIAMGALNAKGNEETIRQMRGVASELANKKG